MRIAIYHNLHSGGAKRALYEITRRLSQKHAIDVYTLSTADHGYCDLRPFCHKHKVFEFKTGRLFDPPLGRLNQGVRTIDLQRLELVQNKVASEMDETGYDVAFIHHCQFMQAPSVLRFLRGPTIYFCHEPPRAIYESSIERPYSQLPRLKRLINLIDPFPSTFNYFLARTDKQNTCSASVVLANSAYSSRTLNDIYGISTCINYLGVDIDLFSPDTQPKKEFTLSVGALTAKKGFDFLIQSLALIPIPLRPPLVIVSNYAESREHNYLSELARSLDVKVEFYIGISDDDLIQLYRRAMLFLYTPIKEPFGFAPLESMACGTPVITIREAGVQETVIDGEVGRLVNRHPGKFADAVVGMMANTAETRKMGEAARAHVERNWTWSRTVEQLENNLSAFQ